MIKPYKGPRRDFIIKKIQELDDKIDTHLNDNDFLEAQALENQLSYYEKQLLKTYNNVEMDLLYIEGYPFTA